MALMMAMRGAPPMIGPSAIGAVNSALLLEDSVALANQARASVSERVERLKNCSVLSSSATAWSASDIGSS